MEKRNFVTSFRTTDSSTNMDDFVDSAARAFSHRQTEKDASFEKKASAEDEKADAEG